jgi:hypothetical protein
MTMKKIGLATASLVCLIGGFWIGCSDERDSLGTGRTLDTSGIAAYFPMEEGYSTAYNVSQSNGMSEVIRYTAGSSTSLTGYSAAELFHYEGGNVVDTGYIRFTSTAVYYYSSPTASPEKLLELPLTLGTTWETLSSDDADPTDTTLITGGNDGSKTDDTTSVGDGDYGDGRPDLTLPVDGAFTMTVAGNEPLELKTGEFFSDALKVIGSSRTGQTNYYWYVAGVGLAKYVIEATPGGLIDGYIVGELVSYGF